MTFLHDGMEYNIDGDVVDSRNRVIQDLKTTVAGFRKRDYAEVQLRNKSPALQDAWDKYQTLLALTKVEE